MAAETDRIDGDLVGLLRRAASEEITRYIETARGTGGQLPTEADQRQLAVAAMRERVRAESVARMQRGEQPIAAAAADAAITAAVTAMFSRWAKVEALFAPGVTNVYGCGHDDWHRDYLDGTREDVASPFTSNDELIDDIQEWAMRAGATEKAFNPSSPVLDLTSPDGSRLWAMGWLGPKPLVALRRPLSLRWDLGDLHAQDMYDGGIRSLLAATARDRANVMIVGPAGAGKTTLQRAMLAEADPDERIATLEGDPELLLERWPERHRHVLALWERPDGPSGTGGFPLHELVKSIQRAQPDRIVVGEIRRVEAVDMLEAMTQGVRGSICTMHADSTRSVAARLAVYCAPRGWDWEAVMQLAAMALDYIVLVEESRTTRRRVVAEIRHVDDYDPVTKRLVTSEWFVRGPAGRAVPNPDSPIPADRLEPLCAAGYDPSAHTDPPVAGFYAGNGDAGAWR